MPISEARFGTDLRLLRNLERQSDRDRGSDLLVVRRTTRGDDLETVGGTDNLKHALLLRFLTHAGELAVLGHPGYGSRLHELIGERNTDTTRNRAKLFVLQAIQAEPRVKEVRSVRVTAIQRDTIEVSVSLIPIDSDTPLNLVFPVSLEGGTVS